MITKRISFFAFIYLMSTTYSIGQQFYRFNKLENLECYDGLEKFNSTNYINFEIDNNTSYKIGRDYKLNSTDKKDIIRVKIVLNEHISHNDDYITNIYRTLNMAEVYLRENFLTGEMKFDTSFDDPHITINYFKNSATICGVEINNYGFYKTCNEKSSIYISNDYLSKFNLMLHEFAHYLIHICEYDKNQFVNHFNDFPCNWDIIDSNILFSGLASINPKTSVQQIMSSRFNDKYFTEADGCDTTAFKFMAATNKYDTVKLVNYYLNCVDCNINQRKFNSLLNFIAGSVNIYKELNESEIEHMNKVYNFQYDKYLIPAIKLNPYLSIGKNDFITQQMEEYRKIRRLKIKAWLDALN